MQIPNQLAVNDVIDQYRVVKLIAQSENAQVYLVYSEALATRFALKLDISAFHQTNEASCPITLTRDFVEQAKLMYALNEDEHLVSVMHTGMYEDKLGRFSSALEEHATQKNKKMAFFVMPYYQQNLADLMAVNNGKLSIKQAIDCLHDMLLALHYLHNKGVIHLDIKPENIFVDDKYRFVLGDLDNAQLLATSSLRQHLKQEPEARANIHNEFNGVVRLSPQFASPEQKQAGHKVSAKSDLYSLGRVIIKTLTGAIPQDSANPAKLQLAPQSLTDNDTLRLLKENHVPNWLQTLLLSMTNQQASDRIDSANACSEIVNTNLHEAEQENTQVWSDGSLYSANTQQLRKQIKQILLSHGRVVEAQIDLLQSVYFSHEDLTKQEIKELLEAQIDEVKHGLIIEHSLANWFAWVSYLQDRQKREGLRMTQTEYQQQLTVGRTTRPDSPDAAEKVLAAMFTPSSSLGSATMTRFVIPIVLIVIVYTYWALDIHPVFFESSQYESSLAQKQDKENKSESASLSLQNENEPPNNQLNNQNLQSKNPQTTQDDVFAEIAAEENVAVIDIQNDLLEYEVFALSQKEGKVMSWRHNLRLYQALRKSIDEPLKAISFDTLRVNKDFAVMRHEVTQALYQLCIDEGICRRNKQFSTAKSRENSAFENKEQHPMVNVSWYEVTQSFIPWLNEKTQKRFMLPRLQEWQMFANQAASLSIINRTSHCKNCANVISRTVESGTIEVAALPADSMGLLGVSGNAQEWLLDCAISNQIERCDQALVIGGSWLDNRDILQGVRPSVLLKRAATPTTGFRLIEQLND